MPKQPEPGASAPPPYHHGDLRVALLAAARRVIEAEGAGALSLRGLARAVGVSAPAVYHHFAGLEALAAAVAAEGFGELRARLAPTARTGLLRAVGVAYVAFACDHPGLYRLMFADVPAALRPAEASALRCERMRASEVLAAGLPGSMTETQRREAALALWALVHGLAMLLIDGQIAPGVAGGVVGGAAGEAADRAALVDRVLGRLDLRG